MTLGIDNLQEFQAPASGGFDGSSGTVSLSQATTAGSCVIVCAVVGTDGAASPSHQLTMSGFTQIAGPSGAFTNLKVACYIFAKPNVSAGENNWTLSALNSGLVAWRVYEATGIGLEATLLNRWYVAKPAAVSSYQGSDVSTQITGTSDDSSCYDTLVLAVHGARSNSTSVPAWSGQTNGLTEEAEASQVNATNAVSMAVSYLPALVLGTFSSTASLSVASPADGTVAVFYADGARHAPNLDVICGAEFGLATTLSLGSTAFAGTAVCDILGATAPTVETTHPRSGVYGFKLSASAATCFVGWDSTGHLGRSEPTSGYAVLLRAHYYFETSLPGADLELASVDAGSTGTLTVWYRSASGKIGVKVGTGTEVLSDATISADKHVGIDIRYDPRVTNHLCDWQVDYDSINTATSPTAQTQAVGAGTSATSVTAVRVGWHSSRTATVYVDDIAVSKSWGAYPVGRINIRPLKVDAAGTVTISGDATNFKTWTSNGTMAALASPYTAVKQALGDVPPVIGASSAGLAFATAVAIADYVQIPMETLSAAPDDVLYAARWYFAGWAAGAQPMGFSLHSYDGVEDLTLIPDGDHGLDSSATVWLTSMQSYVVTGDPYRFYPLTQAKLDALALRFRAEADAAPDGGIHFALLELCTAPAIIYGSTMIENGAFQLYVRQNFRSGAIASIEVTTPPGTRGATAAWTVGGSSGSQYVNPNTTWEKSLGGEFAGDVSFLGLTPDNT